MKSDYGDYVRVLARDMKTSPEDDSLALDNSILYHSLVEMERGRKILYVLSWPVMIIVSIIVMIKTWSFRLWMTCKRFVAQEKADDAWKLRWFLGPERGTFLFDIGHPLGYDVRNGVTTSKALDVIYSIPVLEQSMKKIRDRVVFYWLNQPEGAAVRNRLRIVYQSILDELSQLADSGRQKIHLVSLACGSAQAVIEAIAQFRRINSDVEISLTLVDLNMPSLRRAARLAQARGVDQHLEILHMNIREFVEGGMINGADIVEMVGFLDYRSETSFASICSAVKTMLHEEAMFIVSNIGPSPWAFVVRWLINWPALIRRTPEDVSRLLKESGFSESKTNVFSEPQGIHILGVCRK